MGFESLTVLHAAVGDRSDEPPPYVPEQAIGAPLEDIRARLLAFILKLEGRLGEHAAPLLEAARTQLEQRACRIAVIGQIKAGKSTFINALTGRPGFLPTDINPWTAVVSSLHFRKAPEPPEHAAVFHLFTADEWKGLAEGGGRLRELTERLVPGFQPELLRAQLEVMRKRAERRLGPKFAELLGQCHKFKEVTPELLASYVSAGDDSHRGLNGKHRLYSDITRTADLYFSDSPFAYPITLIDTPGTNDPFLVRDEITRRSLENPDIYVFVISALQPLSAADIAMLRLLNGLHKDRIVVFINRADQLPNAAAEASAIKTAVEKRLRLEFPALSIPVICGSAWLANLGLQTKDFHAVLKPSHVAALRQVGLPATIDATSAQLSNAERSRVAAAIHMSSGMREVSAAITALMCTGSIAMLLRQIAACLTELVRASDVADRAELKAILDTIAARRKESDALTASIAVENKSLATFEARANNLRASFQDMEAHLDDIVTTGCQNLRTELTAIVREYADAEAGALLKALQARGAGRTWRCDVSELRNQLETTYVERFAQLSADLARVEQFLYPQLKVVVASLLPDYRGNLLEAPVWSDDATPSLAPLANKVAVELGTSWWRHWFTARRAVQDRADDLKKLIEDDFNKIVDELVFIADDSLRLRVHHTMQRVNAVSDGLMNGVERRRANLAIEQSLLNGSCDPESLRQFEAEQLERAAACRSRQALFTATLGELDTMLESLDTMQSDGGLRLQ